MKFTIALLVCFACSLMAAADGAVLTLFNEETNWLYYSIDPVLSGSASSFSAVNELFSALDKMQFSSLPPGASVRLEGLAAGEHAVIGFWVTDKAATFGVFRLDLRLAAGESSVYRLKKTAAVAAKEIATSPSQTKKDAFKAPPIVIDGDVSDWMPYPAVAAFPPGSTPMQFTVQDKDGTHSLPLRHSYGWERSGTKLLQFKAFRQGDTLLFYVLSSCPIENGLSLFLYLFNDRRSTEPNNYTIELPVSDAGGQGRVLLWNRGAAEPAEIGVFRTSGTALEASIELARLPGGLASDLFDSYFFDLKTSYFDAARGRHEEFYFTTVDCRDIDRLN